MQIHHGLVAPRGRPRCTVASSVGRGASSFAGLTYPVGAIRTILNVDSDVFCAMMAARHEPDGIDRAVFDS